MLHGAFGYNKSEQDTQNPKISRPAGFVASRIVESDSLEKAIKAAKRRIMNDLGEYDALKSASVEFDLEKWSLFEGDLSAVKQGPYSGFTFYN